MGIGAGVPIREINHVPQVFRTSILIEEGPVETTIERAVARSFASLGATYALSSCP